MIKVRHAVPTGVTVSFWDVAPRGLVVPHDAVKRTYITAIYKVCQFIYCRNESPWNKYGGRTLLDSNVGEKAVILQLIRFLWTDLWISTWCTRARTHTHICTHMHACTPTHIQLIMCMLKPNLGTIHLCQTFQNVTMVPVREYLYVVWHP
jgi:hypothetical protein